MKPIASLSGSHLRTYRTLFQHPVSHNLGWEDVRALMREIAQVEEEPNGNLKVTRHGQTFVLGHHRTKDIAETEELMAVRHFLERSEQAEPAANAAGTDWLLVLDHREARIFRTEMHGDLPVQILPHDPDDYFRHAHHSKDFARGQEKPDPDSYFAPVAGALTGGGRILVFGTGTGRSSEMDQFVAWAKQHHAALAARIVGALVVDEHHLTTDQLLAKAREFYAGAGKRSA